MMLPFIVYNLWVWAPHINIQKLDNSTRILSGRREGGLYHCDWKTSPHTSSLIAYSSNRFETSGWKTTELPPWTAFRPAKPKALWQLAQVLSFPRQMKGGSWGESFPTSSVFPLFLLTGRASVNQAVRAQAGSLSYLFLFGVVERPLVWVEATATVEGRYNGSPLPLSVHF